MQTMQTMQTDYKIGQEVVITGPGGFGYNNRIGQKGKIDNVDEDSVLVKFDTPDEHIGFTDGWFYFDAVAPVNSAPIEITVESAINFLISKGYQLTIQKGN